MRYSHSSVPAKVVVVVPLFRAVLKPYEVQSIESLRTHLLPKYDVKIVTQENALADIKSNKLFEGFQTELFSEEFASYQGYNRLMKSIEFFERFGQYSHMLIFQSDCLAFSGDLSPWIDAGIDYVGAPWVKKHDATGDLEILGVGNGGLSFRRIASAIEVLKRLQSWRTRILVTTKFTLPSIPVLWHKCCVDRFWPRYHIGSRNEDVFWSQVAPVILPNYRVANVDQAYSFAFEREPELCFEANGRQLPLGLHAFQRYAERFLQRLEPNN